MDAFYGVIGGMIFALVVYLVFDWKMSKAMKPRIPVVPKRKTHKTRDISNLGYSPEPGDEFEGGIRYNIEPGDEL